MSQELEHQTRAQKPFDEVPPKSASLAGFSATYGEGRRRKSGGASSGQEVGQNTVDAGQHLFQDINTFPDTETGDPVEGVPGEDSPEQKNVSFDRLFSSLSELLPGIVWSILCALLGKADEQPSSSALKKMREGWETFFKACGVEYVGDGFNVKLSSPFWLLLVPVVATLAAVAGEFGLLALFDKKPSEIKANTDEKAPG